MLFNCLVICPLNSFLSLYLCKVCIMLCNIQDITLDNRERVTWSPNQENNEAFALGKLSIKLEWELAHLGHVKNETAQNWTATCVLRECRADHSQVAVSLTWKHLGSELCSVQIVKGGVRHGILERRKEGAPGSCYSLFIQVIAMLMKTAVAYNHCCLPAVLKQGVHRNHLRSWGL